MTVPAVRIADRLPRIIVLHGFHARARGLEAA
jgi:hypothetical protein